MTHNCELCESGFTFSSRRLIIMLSTICFFCIYVDQMIIYQRFNVAIFSLMFTPLFWKVFIDILMIYELPKVHKKITKYSKKNTCFNKLYQENPFSLHQILSLFPTINLAHVLEINIFGRHSNLRYLKKCHGAGRYNI